MTAVHPVLHRQPVVRALVVSTATTSLGNGVFTASSFLYYTRIQGVPAATVGSALTVVGLIAIGLSVPLSRKLEPLDTAVLNTVLLLAQAVGIVGLILARPTAPLLSLVGLVTVVSQLKLGARGALVARGVATGDRMAVRAWVRTVSNIGIGCGSALAGLAVAADTPRTYTFALAAVAACYLAGAWPIWRLRGHLHTLKSAAGPRTGAPSGPALRDRRYLAIAVLSGLLGMHYLLIPVGLPLWASVSPVRPLWVIAAGLTLNTVVVALGQVPLARTVRDVRGAYVAVAAAGGCFLLACCVIAVAGHLPQTIATAAVLLAVLVYSLGEILHATGSWELSFELAPLDRATEYQSVFAAGLSFGTVVAPAVLTAALTGLGDPGWVAVGGGLAALGAAHLLLARRPHPATVAS